MSQRLQPACRRPERHNGKRRGRPFRHAVRRCVLIAGSWPFVLVLCHYAPKSDRVVTLQKHTGRTRTRCDSFKRKSRATVLIRQDLHTLTMSGVTTR